MDGIDELGGVSRICLCREVVLIMVLTTCMHRRGWRSFLLSGLARGNASMGRGKMYIRLTPGYGTALVPFFKCL